MQPIVPPVFRTGVPLIDRNLDAIATAFRRLGQAIQQAVADAVAKVPANDHEVKATASDVTHGPLIDETEAGTGVTIDAHTTSGKPRMRISADVSTIVNTIINNPTTVQTITNVVTNTVSPAVVQATLYPALVKDPLYRGEAKGLLQYGEDGSVLTQTTGVSTWYVGVAAGQLYLRDASANPTIAVNDGDLVGYWLPGLASDSSTRAHLGLYKVLDCGHHWDGDYTHAPVNTVPMIARVTSANTPSGLCHNSVWSIEAGGAAYAGYSFTMGTSDPIVVDTTLLDFTASAGYTPSDAYELLTGPQLASEHASNDVFNVSATMANGDADMDGFETIVGTPGLDAIPAGTWTFDNEMAWLDPAFPPSPGSVTTLRWRILNAQDPGPTELFYAESPPLILGSSAPLSFQYADSGHAISPTNTLVAIPRLHTTSTTPVNLILLVQSPSRLTRITVPFTLPIDGAIDGVHNHLTGRDKDVGSSDPTKTDPCHPACALGPGMMQIGCQALTTVAGCIPAPTSNTLLVTVAGDSYGEVQFMGTTGLKSGTLFHLVFLNACKIEPYNAESGLTQPANSAPFVLDTNAAGSQNEIDWLTIPVTLGRLGLTYYATELPQSPCFLLTEEPIV